MISVACVRGKQSEFPPQRLDVSADKVQHW